MQKFWKTKPKKRLEIKQQNTGKGGGGGTEVDLYLQDFRSRRDKAHMIGAGPPISTLPAGHATVAGPLLVHSCFSGGSDHRTVQYHDKASGEGKYPEEQQHLRTAENSANAGYIIDLLHA